jgi:tyrosyl-DNA phosphodiesterase-1
MSNPSPSPIKIYATKQDEEMRKEHTTDHWTYTHCWTLREMLGLNLDEAIDWMVISNFIIDFDFLLEEIPELVSIPNSVLVIYGTKDNSEDRWKQYATQPDGSCSVEFLHRDPSTPKQSPSNPLKVQMPWGCHHTKFFLVGFSSGRVRVIVHTANLRWNDVHLKTQGAFVQDFRLQEETTESSSSSEFENTLVAYLETYHCHQPRVWRAGTKPCTLASQIQKYDFSTAVGVLIPSTPGYHKPRPQKEEQVLGYLKVRQAILKYIPSPPLQQQQKASSPIICQFSSIGSLSQKYLNALWSAWDVASVHRVAGPKENKKGGADNNQLQLIYPTVEEIFRSVEGIHGGSSVPGRRKNVMKQFLLPLYRKWASSSSDDDALQKGQNVPHLKTYYQIDDDVGGDNNDDSMKWFVLSSHNLSKGKKFVVMLAAAI